MSLLEQDIIRKKRVNKKTLQEPNKFEIGNNKKYKVKTIIDSAIYGKKANM